MFDDLQVHKQAEQVSGLVRAGDVAGLVLHPELAGKPDALADSRPGRKRRHREPPPVDARDLGVEPTHKRDEGLVCHAVRASHVVGVQKGPEADEGIGFGVVLGELQDTEVEAAPQHMIAAVTCVSTAEGERLRRIGDRTTTAAHQPARRCGRSAHSLSRTPVRALNSSIIASQAGTTSRMAVQNEGSRRTRKSSSEIPCCSTQV